MSQRRRRTGLVVVVVVVERLGQLVGVPHLGVRVHRLEIGVLAAVPVRLQHALVGAHRDAARAPFGPAAPAVVAAAAQAAAERGRALLVLGLLDALAKDAPQQPAPAHVVGVDHAAAAELDALPRVVDPRKVDVQGRLDDAEDDRHGVGLASADVELAPDPVEAVQAAVRAEGHQVEGVDDGRHGRLPQEQQLRQHAGGLEDLGEDPHPLLSSARPSSSAPTRSVGATYRREAPDALKDEHHKWRQHERDAQDAAAHLPRQLALARPRVDPLHDAEDVKRRQDVEDLEEQVPHRVLDEDVEVARAEDEGVEALRDKGHALGGPVAVDGKDEDAFRQGVGQVAQDAEDLDGRDGPAPPVHSTDSVGRRWPHPLGAAGSALVGCGGGWLMTRSWGPWGAPWLSYRPPGFDAGCFKPQLQSQAKAPEPLVRTSLRPRGTINWRARQRHLEAHRTTPPCPCASGRRDIVVNAPPERNARGNATYPGSMRAKPLLLPLLAAGAWRCVDAGIAPRDMVPDDESLARTYREHAHYDKRFFKEILGEETHRDIIRVLVQTYLATLDQLGVQTWLMHGSLLGWWWGKKVMPWDLDADVQVTEADMYYLAAYHNMTTYYYRYGGMAAGRYFLLDVNPYFTYRGRDDFLNFIDARWVDMQSGLYIDITAARYDPEHAAGAGVLYDKNEHEFKDTFLYPLRETTFEGVAAKIPYRYQAMLESEYGKAALMNNEYRGRTNVGDESFSLDIAGLGASSSTRGTPGSSGRKRKRSDVQPSSSARSARSARDPYELLSTSKESDGPARPPSRRGASSRRSSSRQPRDAAAAADDDDDELEALHPPPSTQSPVRTRVSSAVEEVEESPAHAPGSGRRRSVPLSAAASSSTRLQSALGTDDAAPSSSPLVDKSRRSSVRRSSARPIATIPEADELRDPTPEPSPHRQPVQPEAEEPEDDSPAEEIDAVEAANALGRPRLSSSPELGSADVAEAPKRKRGRPNKSPAKQRQPARKPRTKPEASRKRPAKDGDDDGDDKSKDGDDAIEITVQRFVNHKGREGADPLQATPEIPFANRGGETVVDVFAQVCDEVIVTTLAQFEQLLEGADGAKKKEYRIKMRALEAYREELKSRLLQHAIHLNHWHSLRKQVRQAHRDKLSLREEILRLRGEREQVALRMDAIRAKHETESQASTRRINASTLMHDIDLAVEQGKGAPEPSRAAQKTADLGNLDLLIARVVDEASSASATGGLLRQVQDFNALLERAALALESR
ncbi:mannosylphosphorylation protein (Mnn4) [Purpureocillium lavendulum]|uniref:Mannosylphosphorylation protein (Mnn4) n=1 Tax=Purpureocillium lavendulum TaxID=1247861 RepID=A0AB34FW47_9HYPO|nr:mannosylphosphorylation protein (Mnn4) [Purpureocillium lavendulum]